MKEEKWHTAIEAAKYVKRSKRTVQNARMMGRYPNSRKCECGYGYMYPQSDLDAFNKKKGEK